MSEHSSKYKLNIGKKEPPSRIKSIQAQGEIDGWFGTPNSRYLVWPHIKDYLNGYQATFRDRKRPEGYDRGDWMRNSFFAMFDKRYDIPGEYAIPPQA